MIMSSEAAELEEKTGAQSPAVREGNEGNNFFPDHQFKDDQKKRRGKYFD